MSHADRKRSRTVASPTVSDASSLYNAKVYSLRIPQGAGNVVTIFQDIANSVYEIEILDDELPAHPTMDKNVGT